MTAGMTAGVQSSRPWFGENRTAPVALCRTGPYVGLCYRLDEVASAAPFDLALIDGPPARTIGRFMTLPLLWPHLSRSSLIVLDDASRRGYESVWLTEWTRMFPDLRVLVSPGYAKGLALLQKTGDTDDVRYVWAVALKAAGRYVRNTITSKMRRAARD